VLRKVADLGKIKIGNKKIGNININIGNIKRKKYWKYKEKKILEIKKQYKKPHF
jgi:formiminotetrahydrofolate cyclodeaminase